MLDEKECNNEDLYQPFVLNTPGLSIIPQLAVRTAKDTKVLNRTGYIYTSVYQILFI